MTEEVDYVEQAGPGILELPEGEAAEEQQQALQGEVLEELPRWEQAAVEQFLMGTGSGLHYMFGVAERDWAMTKTDLERIAPALTRICNRYEPVARLAPIADPLLVAHGLVLYAWRSELERVRALRDREEALEKKDRYERVETPADGDVEVADEEIPEHMLAARPAFPDSPKADTGESHG